MIFDDDDLRQIDEAYVKSLDIETAKKLAVKLAEDLKEARERLNQNPNNSSRPPSSVEPWVVAETEDGVAAGQGSDSGGEESSPDPKSGEAGTEKEDKKEDGEKSDSSRRPGKQQGAAGKGRTQQLLLTGTVIHFAELCCVCDRELSEADFTARTGYFVIDIATGDEAQPIITLTNTKHLYGDTKCPCGHIMHTAPHRCEKEEDWNVELTEWRLVGPMLMSLICSLAMRMRLSRARIREFLADWLQLELSTGTINQCIHEAGRACEPLEEQILQEIRDAYLVFGDETSWKQKGLPYWLWAFVCARAVLFTICRRTKETVHRILGEGFAGWLMSDGYQAYRDYLKRLRCWAHLNRKAEGIAQSLNKKAQEFGEVVLKVLKALMEAVYRARAGPMEDLAVRHADLLAELKLACEEYKDFALQQDGRIYEKTQALAREFLNDWEAIFRVLEHPVLPLTNNEAERMLRHWVILRKLCYGTRTKQGSRTIGLLASVIETCRLRKVPPWKYLAEVVAERRKGFDPPPIPEPSTS